MTSLRIGIAPQTNETAGGAYQYGQTMLGVLSELRENRDEEFVVLADGVGDDAALVADAGWEIAPLTPPIGLPRFLHAAKRVGRGRLSPRQRAMLTSLYSRLRRGEAAPPVDAPRRRPEVRAWHEQLRIDLIVYTMPTPLSFEAATPYVMAVHDLQHRRYSDFPEFSRDGVFAWREYLFRNAIREATMILADSYVGKEDVLDFYGELIDPERVAVLPFLPATPGAVTPGDRERVRRSYGLPEQYLFYPAHLWPHKNHRRIVEALAAVRRGAGIEADLVLVGSRSTRLREDTYAELMDCTRSLGLEGRVRHLGYVPEGDMPALYAEAVALVMPTFFGPTNIPILEAWALDCPVITSDIRGVREQVGDAGLLVDPESVDAIAGAIRQVWLDADSREELVRRGRARRSFYTREDYAQRLDAILTDAVSFVRAAGGSERV